MSSYTHISHHTFHISQLSSVICFLFSVFCFSSSLGAGVVDQIAGIVGNEVITQSEVEEAMLLSQQRDRTKVLEQLIEHKLLLIEAEQETLEVKSEELGNAVEDAILKVRGRFPSDEDYETELYRSGLTEENLREKYTKEMRENLLIQKLFQKKFGKELAVGDMETLDFYNNYKDSIPPMPDAVKFLGVDVYYRASDDAKDATKRKASNILNRIKKGELFSELAKKYSDDPVTSQRGGDLGTLNPMDLAQEFQSAVVNMKAGEIQIIEVEDAYHIVRCNNRYGDLVMLSDIVIKVQPTQADSLAMKETIETVKERLKVEAIPELHISNTRILTLGEVFVPVQETPFSELGAIEVGKVYVFNTPGGFQVIKPVEIREERMLEWEDLRLELKELLHHRKLQMNYEKLIHKLKQEIFVKRML